MAFLRSTHRTQGLTLARAALAAVFVTAIHWTVTRAGILVSPDSVHYLSAAQQWAAGNGLSSAVTALDVPESHVALTPWPPLYPWLLGTLLHWVPDVFLAARMLNAGFLVLGTWLVAGLAGRAAGRQVGAWAYFVYPLLFFPFVLASFAWSETTFIAFTLASLALLDRALDRDGPSSVGLLLAAGALAGLAMLTRYAGTLVIAAGASVIPLLGAHEGTRRVTRNLVVFLVPAAAPNLWWLWRNHSLTGAWFGDRRPDGWFPLTRMLEDASSTLATDFMAPAARDPELAAFAWFTGILGVMILLGVLARSLTRVRFPEEGFRQGTGLLLAVWATVYLAGVFVFVSRVGLDPINTRYLAPAYPALWILAAAGVRAAMTAERRARRVSRSRRRTAMAAAGLVLAVQALATMALIERSGRDERTLTTPYWSSALNGSVHRDPGLVHLAEIAGDRPVLSNVWEQVALGAGVPSKPLPGVGETTFPRDVLRHPGSVVAVRRGTRHHRVGDRQLSALADSSAALQQIGRSELWTFYRVLQQEGVRGVAAR